MTTLLFVVAVLVLVAVAAGIWIMIRRQHTESLRARFGPEYRRTLLEHGDRSKAENELDRRRERVEALQLSSLSRDEVDGYRARWQEVQQRFVDSPSTAIADADALVRAVMQQRGYPIGNFEQRAADLSVDHPNVVSNYRSARTIAQQNEQGAATTDDLRSAMLNYRSLFDDLLGTDTGQAHEGRKAS